MLETEKKKLFFSSLLQHCYIDLNCNDKIASTNETSIRYTTNRSKMAYTNRQTLKLMKSVRFNCNKIYK